MTTERTLYAIVPPTGLYVREDRCQTPLEKFRTIAIRPPIVTSDGLCVGATMNKVNKDAGQKYKAQRK